MQSLYDKLIFYPTRTNSDVGNLQFKPKVELGAYSVVFLQSKSLEWPALPSSCPLFLHSFLPFSDLPQGLCTWSYPSSTLHVTCSLASFKALLEWLHVSEACLNLLMSFKAPALPTALTLLYPHSCSLSDIACLFMYLFSPSPSTKVGAPWGQELCQFCSWVYPNCLKQFVAYGCYKYVLNKWMKE